jgi:hypothetical protein
MPAIPTMSWRTSSSSSVPVARQLDDDLAVIAGVGQCLLIAGHAGGKDRFPERLANLAKRLSGEDTAVFKYQ